MPRRGLAVLVCALVAMSVAESIPVSADGRSAEKVAKCPPPGPIRASSLPRSIPAHACDLRGRVINDHGARATVPPPGRGVHAEVLKINGVEELEISTARDGDVTISKVGSESMAPHNDNFAAAQEISAPASVPGSNVGATVEPDEPWICSPEGTVWYRLDPPHAASYRVTVENPSAELDPFLGVFEGSSLESLAVHDCANGGIAGEEETTAFAASAGQTYYVQVGGSLGTEGTFTLNLSEIAPPPNDAFALAEDIDSLPVSTSVNLEGATAENSEPTGSCIDSRRHIVTAWYKLTPAQATRVMARADSNDSFTFLAVYTGGDLPDLHEVGCHEYDLTFEASAGTTYYFQVGAWSYSPEPGGEVHISIQGAVSPTNDHFADAVEAAPLPYEQSIDVEDAPIGLEPGEPACGSPEQTLWYRHTAMMSTRMTAWLNSSDSQAILGVYSGTSLSDLVEVECTTEYVTEFTARAGNTYYFRVGQTSREGILTFELDGVELPPAPSNDDFDAARSVGALPYSDTIELGGATVEDGEPLKTCGGNANATAWYKLRPTSTHWTDSSVRATHHPLEASVAVYRGPSLDRLTRLKCNSGNVIFNARKGTSYWIQVGRTSDEGSRVTLDVKKTVSPWEPCRNCKPACEDARGALMPYKVMGTFRWRANLSRRPANLSAREALSAIKSGVAAVVEGRNDCGIKDKISARASYLGKTSKRSNICSGAAWDGTNVIDFGRFGSMVLGYTCYTYRIRRGHNPLIEADIRFSSGRRFTVNPTAPGCSNKVDLAGVAAHEFGHAFGLNHSPGPNLTMYWQSAHCTPAFRTFGLGDLKGLQKLY